MCRVGKPIFLSEFVRFQLWNGGKWGHKRFKKFEAGVLQDLAMITAILMT